MGNRLTKLTNNLDDTNSIVFDYNDYDKVGNRLSMKIDDASAHVYTYDKLHQLTFVDYNDGNSTGYAYDDLGNRTDVNENGNVTSYVSNSLNQYTSVGGTGCLYDENGNYYTNGTFQSWHDCENRMTQCRRQNQYGCLHKYDYAGRRVKKDTTTTSFVVLFTTKFCYDGDQVIAEYDGNNNLLRKFVYGPGIDEPICMIDVADNNEVYYYHFDGLGGIIVLSDQGANIADSSWSVCPNPRMGERLSCN